MIEALKLALKWAEKHGEVVFNGGGMIAVDSMNKWQNAVKEAIAELESQERRWVGLTIEEIASCCRESTTTQLSFYNAIEAKLKDKNWNATHPPQRTEQNFCSRCGKRTKDIHTCTPPMEQNT
jgi:hypothetical protein